MRITYQPIGVVRSPFSTPDGMPIQPTSGTSANGTIEIFPQFAEGLKDIEGFSHLILLYHLHRAGRGSLIVTPFLDSKPHGVFATRAPVRPNPIGLSVVRLLERVENVLNLAHVDILDGTPVLDIKPFVPAFDAPRSVRTGWLEAAGGEVHSAQSDDRFT